MTRNPALSPRSHPCKILHATQDSARKGPRLCARDPSAPRQAPSRAPVARALRRAAPGRVNAAPGALTERARLGTVSSARPPHTPRGAPRPAAGGSRCEGRPTPAKRRLRRARSPPTHKHCSLPCPTALVRLGGRAGEGGREEGAHRVVASLGHDLAVRGQDDERGDALHPKQLRIGGGGSQQGVCVRARGQSRWMGCAAAAPRGTTSLRVSARSRSSNGRAIHGMV